MDIYVNVFVDEPEDDDDYQPPAKRTFRSRGRPRKSGTYLGRRIKQRRSQPFKFVQIFENPTKFGPFGDSVPQNLSRHLPQSFKF